MARGVYGKAVLPRLRKRGEYVEQNKPHDRFKASPETMEVTQQNGHVALRAGTRGLHRLPSC